MEPIAALQVPIFFVMMGMRVDLTAFASLQVLWLALLFTAAAIAGKQAYALGVLGTNLSGFSIGICMISGGEVGLGFTSIGMSLSLDGKPVIDATTLFRGRHHGHPNDDDDATSPQVELRAREGPDSGVAPGAEAGSSSGCQARRDLELIQKDAARHLHRTAINEPACHPSESRAITRRAAGRS